MKGKKIDMIIPLMALLLLVTSFLLYQFSMLLNRSQKNNAELLEMTILSNNVLQDNNYLIKTMKVYVLNRSEKYLNEYLHMLNNYDSFHGRLERMNEIGLTERESEIVLQIKETWDKLEEIEKYALAAIESGNYDEAVSIVYGDEYEATDNLLAYLIQNLAGEIVQRGRIITDSMNRQVQNVMALFSLSFLVILTILTFSFINNNKLKNLYKRQKEEVEVSSRYKSIFLATMSHEIRTPMNAILGITEIQMRGENLPPETEDAFSKIYESGNLLLNIINDILDLSKIEAGKLEILPVRYDIPSLINDTIVLNSLRFESKPIEFNLELDENTPHDLYGDDLRIRQILNNILSNAFKYTDEGDILMSVYPENEDENPGDVTIVFCIRDTGQGMTEEQIKMLFDEYSRFNQEANRKTAGTGLGMNITKKLVDLMNGEIFVKSEAGKGSEFTVKIPQKKASNKLCGKDVVSFLQKNKFRSKLFYKKTQIVREYMPYGSVLVVDDVESNLFVARGMLMPYGLKIETVTSGFSAIEKIEGGNVYDIIFMDHMMPKMDGIETVRIIREMGYNGNIVALTANAIAGHDGLFLGKGFNAYLSKPIDSRELNSVLNDLIRDKQPPEVLEAARNEQKEKSSNIQNIKPEISKFFLNDVNKAIKVLENIDAKLQSEESSVLDDDDLRAYIVAIHGIKAALANIGEERLSGIALMLEKAGHEKDFIFIAEKNSDYLIELKMLSEKFKPEENIISETDKAEINGEDLELLKSKMREIKSACLLFDKKSIKDILSELKNKTWPAEIEAAMDDISLNLLHSDFDKAAERASELAN